MTDYLADVRRYDALADEEIVDKIVKHLGIALRNRDSSLVSCSDERERGTVKTSWCGKKLGIVLCYGGRVDDNVRSLRVFGRVMI